MAQYPNYFPMGQQPMYNQPYADRMAQLQQYQQQIQQMPMQPQMQQMPQMPTGLNGRIVDDFSVLNANDVPMDGNGAVFIKRDGSEIQIRRWGNMGNIEMTSYAPRTDGFHSGQGNYPQDGESFKIGLSEDVMAAFMQRFDELMGKIESLEKMVGNPKTAKTKKEADAE